MSSSRSNLLLRPSISTTLRLLHCAPPRRCTRLLRLHLFLLLRRRRRHHPCRRTSWCVLRRRRRPPCRCPRRRHPLLCAFPHHVTAIPRRDTAPLGSGSALLLAQPLRRAALLLPLWRCLTIGGNCRWCQPLLLLAPMDANPAVAPRCPSGSNCGRALAGCWVVTPAATRCWNTSASAVCTHAY